MALWEAALAEGASSATGDKNLSPSKAKRKGGGSLGGDISGAFKETERSGGLRPDTDIYQPDESKITQVGKPATPGERAPATFTGATIRDVGGPTAAKIDTSRSDEFRGAQTGLVSQLAAQARGEGPSLAQQTLKAGQEGNLAATMAQLASARGGYNPALARSAMQTSAEIAGKAAQEAAMARLQEQMQAQGLLSQVSGQARGQDIGVETRQAELGQEAELARFQGDLQRAVEQGRMDQATAEKIFGEQQQNARMQDDLVKQYMAMGMTAEQANQEAALKMEEMKVGASKAQVDANLAKAGIRQKQGAAVTNAIGQVLGSVFSDRSAKKEIKNADNDVRQFLNALGAFKFKYKDQKGNDEHVSIMAQDAEKTPMGKGIVVETSFGKTIDGNRGFAALMASVAHLNKRLADIEKRRGK